MRAAEFQRLNNTAPQASEMWQRTETAPHRTESAPRNETQRVPVARGVQTSERLLTTTSRGAQTSERLLATTARGVQTTPPGGHSDDAETHTDPQPLRVCAETQTDTETEKRVFANAKRAAESIFLRRYELMTESDEEAGLSMVSLASSRYTEMSYLRRNSPSFFVGCFRLWAVWSSRAVWSPRAARPLLARCCLFLPAWSPRPVLSARVARLPGGLSLLLGSPDSRAVRSGRAVWPLSSVLPFLGSLASEASCVF